ncbi:hypothetical protein SAMN05216464_110106 [Mucilaginibacter pineti]|uniref:Uncharacterized protein n=1 Tax=Mucilaginibacter pineti TaxID=1391627 RepID=A0A1G7GER8_9SPHI|nr:hypothetical protein [Mucilaginibacter pineti]SDE86509.1 hypothetical protein SAMN05216464_110106 [Mucilaginibacter pineti]
MKIKDLQGKVIEVTDPEQAINIVREFLRYRHEQRTESLIRFEHQRTTYWRDVYRQLVMLQHSSSGTTTAQSVPEFITEENMDDWQCICGNNTFRDGFETCDPKGNIMEPLIGSIWECHYLCASCGRIIDQETFQVIGINTNSL